MKLFSVLFLTCVSASTLLSPLYELLAGQVITAGKNALTGIKEQLTNQGLPTAVIDQFETELDNLSTGDVVTILRQIPLENILEGNLTADDFAMVFENNPAFDNIDFSAMNQEIIANLDPSALGNFEQSMDAFTQLAGSVQNIFNAEITVYNFVAVLTDAVDALSRMNDAFPGMIGGNMAIAYDALFWVSLAAEKAIFFFESYEEYIYMYEDAVLLTELEFERRIDLSNACDSEFDPMGFLLNVSKFFATVIIDNWSEPLQRTVDVWNNFVGNLPYLDDYKIPDTTVATFESCLQDFADSVRGSVVEAKVLLSPFRAQIAGLVQASVISC